MEGAGSGIIKEPGELVWLTGTGGSWRPTKGVLSTSDATFHGPPEGDRQEAMS